MSAAAMGEGSPPSRVELSVAGMTCASCAARVEKRLRGVPGVAAASVNLVTGRATAVVAAGTGAADLIAAVEQAGCEAELLRPRDGRASGSPAEPGGSGLGGSGLGGSDAAAAGYLRWRLIVAAVFFIPLSDVSVLLSLFPAYRFPGWQWVLVVLAAPVVGWAAWPFHRAAGWDGSARGAFAVGDALRENAAAAVARLRQLGLRTVLLTGDGRAAAAAVAVATGVDEVIAEALPDAKAEVAAGLRAQGRSVAMVGDGVNDGPALAAADLGLALDTGTDVAISAADIVVLRDDLRAIPEALMLARATMATIRQNLAWAFGYNIAAIPVAGAGLCNPLIAGAAMAISSAFVVTNSVRLRRFGVAGRAGVLPWSRPGARARRPDGELTVLVAEEIQ